MEVPPAARAHPHRSSPYTTDYIEWLYLLSCKDEGCDVLLGCVYEMRCEFVSSLSLSMCCGLVRSWRMFAC